MNLEEKLLGMKRKLDSLAQARDRSKIEADLLHKRLMDDHGLKNVKEAEKAIAKLEREADLLEKENAEGLESLERDHQDLLELAR